MLIKLESLTHKYSVQSKGFIHCGASMLQEFDDYLSCGFDKGVFIDAIPEMYNYAKDVLEKHPSFVPIHACLSDVDGQKVTFNISNNGGESSSIFEFGTHKTHHPDVDFVKTIELETSRLDTILNARGFDISAYDFWNLDLQSAELLALKGAGSLLEKVNYIYTEVNWQELYKGGCTIEQIDIYLNDFGFIRVETQKAGSFGWGDAFYIKP